MLKICDVKSKYIYFALICVLSAYIEFWILKIRKYLVFLQNAPLKLKIKVLKFWFCCKVKIICTSIQNYKSKYCFNSKEFC
ncbi:hypothetical protein BU034_12390 [Staphylococcus simulans]|nr:hypothetical protein BU034_12390 [Staphylococcus simulans]